MIKVTSGKYLPALRHKYSGKGNFKQEYGEIVNPGFTDQVIVYTQDVDRKNRYSVVRIIEEQ